MLKKKKKNIAEHSDKNCSNIVFNSSLRIMEIKTKINEWNLIKLKRFAQQRTP